MGLFGVGSEGCLVFFREGLGVYGSKVMRVLKYMAVYIYIYTHIQGKYIYIYNMYNPGCRYLHIIYILYTLG